MATYTVYSVDMWGHVPAECCAAYDCPCVHVDADDVETHDGDACECYEDCNDRFRSGAIEVADDASDAAVLDALFADGLLSEHGRKVCVVDDWACDGENLTIHDDAGRVIFYLEVES